MLAMTALTVILNLPKSLQTGFHQPFTPPPPPSMILPTLYLVLDLHINFLQDTPETVEGFDSYAGLALQWPLSAATPIQGAPMKQGFVRLQARCRIWGQRRG